MRQDKRADKMGEERRVMCGQVVLLVSADAAQLGLWQTEVTQAGQIPLLATSIREAQYLLRQVRPDLVVSGALPRGATDALCAIVHIAAPTRTLLIVVCGDLRADEARHVAADPATVVVAPTVAATHLDSALLTGVLSAARPG